MQGHFDVRLKNARGLGDEDFLQALSAKKLDALLGSLDTELHLAGHNLINDYFSCSFFRNVFAHGIPNAPYPMNTSFTPLNNISLMTTDAEPTPYEHYSWYGGFDGHYDNIGTSTGSKGFGNGRVEDPLYIKDPGGKESVFLRTRFLFLPSEGNSNNIRSIGIMGCEVSNQGTGVEDRYQQGRIRLKDPVSGLPIAVSKNANQVLVVEYTLHLVSL